VAPSRPYLDLTLDEWLASLSGTTMVPAGGSGLAVAVAMAAALVGKVARVSKGSWPAATGIAAQADALLARAKPLAELDADAYRSALEARDSTAGLTSAQRDWEIGRAYAASVEPPLEIARIAADVAELAAEVADQAEPRVRADALAAAELAAAAARGVVAIVAVNLTATAEDARVAEATQLALAAGDAVRRASTS
jgi:formiminotetrahydrofolate cyclodeaminase